MSAFRLKLQYLKALLREQELLEDIMTGYFRETENDAVIEKVDAEGNIIVFSILKVSALKEREPISVSLR